MQIASSEHTGITAYSNLRKRALIIRKLPAFQRCHMNCYFAPYSFTHYALQLLIKTGLGQVSVHTMQIWPEPRLSPNPDQGQVSLGRAQVFHTHTSMGQVQVFENWGRAWASFCSVDTALNIELCEEGTCTDGRNV